ncbi:unnamed protein product [Moneuplotes crassus]|uniref:Mitochondrial import inner membrane translocase subunit n=1 Tax=Euplotes crassus TaxID=5936 RepID=A0AAD2DBU3_EUPCR|nr:unnamed protein product [Moneuplotes crassus]
MNTKSQTESLKMHQLITNNLVSITTHCMAECIPSFKGKDLSPIEQMCAIECYARQLNIKNINQSSLQAIDTQPQQEESYY